jgi:hypothetical protein
MRSDVNNQAGGIVTAVSRSSTHSFSKSTLDSIRLIAGLGVDGDAHMGAKVTHRSRAAADPNLPNLRQVHLIHSELHDELRSAGFDVSAGQMGENITTRNIDLLGLPTAARLHVGESAIVEITGLRKPLLSIGWVSGGLESGRAGS